MKPELIADLYRQRWQVELFFKWIKQHLRIKVGEGVQDVMRDMVAECLALARVAETIPRQLASTAQDLAHAKRREI